MEQKKSGGPLSGLRVLDLGRFVACPTCGMFLGDLGAEVIKIEKAPFGDETRYSGEQKDGHNLYFPTENRNKKSITLNFRSDTGKQLLRELIGKSDILIENFRPGTMDKMGFGYEEVKKINPRMIMASISGYGQTSPLRDRPAFDSVICAVSGIMDVNRGPDGPRHNGLSQIDIYAGTINLVAILSALYNRDKTGRGQYIDTAMFDCALFFLNTFVPFCDATGIIERNSTKNYYDCPAGRWKTKDGYIICNAGTDALYKRLLSINDDPILHQEKYLQLENRLEEEGYQIISEAFQRWIETKTNAEWDEIFTEAGIPCGVINDISDVLKMPAARARNGIVDIEIPGLGPVAFPGCPFHFSDTPVDRFDLAPELGQHNEEVISGLLGHSHEELERFKAEKAI